MPEVASRQHVATIVPVLERAVAEAGLRFADLDAIAVTAGPGLVGALLVGVETAKALAFALGKPLVAREPPRGAPGGRVSREPAGAVRAAAVSASGAAGVGRPHGADPHRRAGRDALLGSTRDDAAGEAFDKVGKMLGLGYPGGVAIDKLAATGDPKAVALPRALPGRDDLDFSFSGLKTAVATLLARRALPEGQALNDLCASFQAAVVDVLVRKSRRRSRCEGCLRWSSAAASPRTAACARRSPPRRPRTASRCTSRRPSTAPTTRP